MRAIHPLTRVSGRVCNPDELKMLFGVFDEVWAQLAREGLGRAGTLEAQRTRLASIIMALARDGQLEAKDISHRASDLMRQAA